MLKKTRPAKQSYSTKLFLSMITALFIGFFSLALSSAAQAKTASTLNLAKAEKSEVLIFTASWCHYCTKMRQFLNNNHIKFTEYDIEKSTLGYQLYRSLGGKGVPVVKIGENVLYGYSPETLKQVLNENGYNLP